MVRVCVGQEVDERHLARGPVGLDGEAVDPQPREPLDCGGTCEGQGVDRERE